MSPNEKQLGKAIEQLDNWLDQSTNEHRRLAKIFTVWLRRSLLPNRFPESRLPELQNLMEVRDMLAQRVTDFSLKWKAEGRKEGEEKGIEKGTASALHTVVINMLADKLPLESISRATGFSLQKITAISEKNQ